MKNVLGTILVLTILLLSRLAAGQAAPGSLDDQLITAAGNGDTATVQQLLQRGAHIEATNRNDWTALRWAAEEGQADVVKLLLVNGANIEAKSQYGDRALHKAANSVSHNEAEVVKALLDKGADFDAKGQSGRTALEYAVSYGDRREIVRLLLDKGANLEARDNAGQTALHCAVPYGNIQVVKLLLDKGANLEARMDDGQTVLLWAAVFGNTEVVRLLLDRGANLTAKDNGGQTALSKAAANGKTEVAALLIERGADLTAQDEHQQTPAMLAQIKYPELADMLRKAGEAKGQENLKELAQSTMFRERLNQYLTDLQKGTNIDALLDRAVREGDSEVAAALIEKGANIEAMDREGNTALLVATHYGKPDVVKLLLDRGANIETKGSAGYPYVAGTALLVAIREGHNDVAKLLIDKGANLEAKDKSGYTALLMAVGQGRADLVKMLIDKGANLEVKGPVDFPHHGNTALLDAVEAGNINLMKLLLDKGANIEVENKDGETALLVAADKGKADVVKLLLDKGAKIEAKSGGVGGTALLFAAYRGNSDVVKLLLERGANIEGKNDRGETALISAQGEEKYSRKGDPNLLATIEVLQHALSQNPQAKLAELLTHLQKNPYDQKTREALIESYTSQQPLPPIPEEARQLFQQASALMKQSSAPSELGKPIDLLEKALVIAPWWGNAYYNLSRAWELKGKYDFALEQLNYYLELKPSEADAAEARAHIAVIQAEKETVARKEQENEALLAVKYVSGGMTRLRYGDVPEWWHFPSDIGTMYLYTVDEEWPFYVNVLRLPNGHPLAAFLIAQSNNGMYAGDRIGVIDLIDQTCLQFNDFAFGEQNSVTTCRTRYYVNVSNQPNATVTVTDPATGASGTLPVALLYRGRALHGKGIFGGCSGTVQQGGARAMVLEFDCNLVKAAEDPTVNAAALTPTTVKPE